MTLAAAAGGMRQGVDVRISPHAVIGHPELVTLGDHVAIDAFVVITTALEIGSYVHIASHCSVTGGVRSKLVMKDFSGFASACRIACGSDDYRGEGLINPTVPAQYRRVTHTTVTMERYATLGTNVVVHPGVTIGEGAVVWSCSLVTRDLESWGIYIGIPARRVGTRERERIVEYAEQIMRTSRREPA